MYLTVIFSFCTMLVVSNDKFYIHSGGFLE